MNDYITLREYINKRDEIETIKVHTFCNLMKKVSRAIDECDKQIPIEINLDSIKININDGSIKFNSLLNLDELSETDKTMVDIRTGVSVVTERKASKESKNIAFALMFLGWYVNEDESVILSDLDVLENFDEYMKKVPNWLHPFFINVFKRMNYQISFDDYYNRYFIGKINSEINEVAEALDMTKDTSDKFGKLIIKTISKDIRGEEAL